ncbi:hypothetical protein RKD38_006327 [Streptomyces ambofaciens]
MTATLIWILVVLVAVGLYLSWTAGRLDRLHARIDAARAALDAQLLRRASVAQELATSGVLDPAASMVLYEAAHAARQAEEESREVAESELSQALRAVFADAPQVDVVREAPGGEAAAHELAEAVRRVPMARRFHNDAVGAARRLREHRKVRWFRLARARALPAGLRDGRRAAGRPGGAGGLSPVGPGPGNENDPLASHWPLLWPARLAFPRAAPSPFPSARYPCPARSPRTRHPRPAPPA